MTGKRESTQYRPMNVVVARGSRAEKHFLALAALPGGEAAHPEVIAPGVRPTPKHNLVYHGGKTLQDLIFTNFYLGGAESWNQSDIQNIDKSLAAAMSDTNLNNVMIQYFSNRPITSGSKPSQVLDGPKPSVFSQGDVENLVMQLYSQGRLGGFDLAKTVFNFMLPSGAVLTMDETLSHQTRNQPAKGASVHNPVHPEEEASSLQGLGGYHGSAHASNQDTIYYAIGVYSETLPNGTDNGIVAFDLPWKNIVATFYHELNEARTDADVEDAIRAGNDPQAIKFLGWMSRQGEECGDFPMFEVGADLNLVMKEVPLTDGSGTVPIQFQYSNAVQGPEGPIPSPHRAKRVA